MGIMINRIRTGDKIWERRSKKLISGEIECVRCGHWARVAKLSDKHFKEEYICRQCNKEIKQSNPRPTKTKVQKKIKPKLPDSCPHRPFFGCKLTNECLTCYYNPDVKQNLWFYNQTKSEIKKRLQTLDDIKSGKGLFKNGTRCYFKYQRKED